MKLLCCGSLHSHAAHIHSCKGWSQVTKSHDSNSEQPIRVSLSEAERDLLLSLLIIELDVERLLQATEVKNGTVEIVRPQEDIDLLLDTIAFEAEHTKNANVLNQLVALFEKLHILLEEG